MSDRESDLSTEGAFPPERYRQMIGSAVRALSEMTHRDLVECEGRPLFSGPAWSKVKYILGLGSSSASKLCLEFGVDPNYDPELETKEQLDIKVAELRQLHEDWKSVSPVVRRAIESRVLELTDGMNDHSEAVGDDFDLGCLCNTCRSYA